MISKASDTDFLIPYPLFNTGKYTTLQPQLSDTQEEGKGNNPKCICGRAHFWLLEETDAAISNDLLHAWIITD